MINNIMCFLSKAETIISVFVPIIALFIACFIPRRIMKNQLYADLVKEYRSPEMGGAILALFHFYKYDCNNNTANIDTAYKEKYEEQIKNPLGNDVAVDFSQTLHFQRRLVAQFYFSMAHLHNSYKFSKEQLKIWFTENEKRLLSLLLHMAEPARQCFEQAENLDAPPHNDEDAAMNRLIYKLYEEVDGFE